MRRLVGPRLIAGCTVIFTETNCDIRLAEIDG